MDQLLYIINLVNSHLFPLMVMWIWALICYHPSPYCITKSTNFSEVSRLLDLAKSLDYLSPKHEDMVACKEVLQTALTEAVKTSSFAGCVQQKKRKRAAEKTEA